MNINEFCYIVDICGGNGKDFIKHFFKKYLKNDEKELKQLFKVCQEIGLFDKNLKYSYNNIVNEMARQKNMEEFLNFTKIDDLKKYF